MENTFKCIYCLKEKPETEFNREHVISRMFGTYNNALVLNQCEVCKECNSYFCDNLENVVSLDSYEGLLRTQHIKKTHHSTGRPIGKTRLYVSGQNDIFKGLRFFISANPNTSEGIQLEIVPSVGIIRNPNTNEYDYYQLSDLPEFSEEIRCKLSQSRVPIITVGYKEEDVRAALISKGYDLSKANYTGGLNISDITTENTLIIGIKSKVDNILSRLAAKNILNYLCFSYGKAYLLNSRFNNLRNFVRYGTASESIKMCLNNGGLAGVPNKVNEGHVIGIAVATAEAPYYSGFVSWFGAITYSFLIEKVSLSPLPKMTFAICDNQSRVITEYHDMLLVEWPNSEYTISVSDEFAIICPKKIITDRGDE